MPANRNNVHRRIVGLRLEEKKEGWGVGGECDSHARTGGVPRARCKVGIG